MSLDISSITDNSCWYLLWDCGSKAPAEDEAEELAAAAVVRLLTEDE